MVWWVMNFDFFEIVGEELLVELRDRWTLSQAGYVLDVAPGILNLVVEVELLLQLKQMRGVYLAIVFRCTLVDVGNAW